MTEDEKWKLHAEAFLHGVEIFVTKYFGERCDEFAADCACCRGWKAYDELKAICD